jgi:hypothetical protein
VYLASVGLKICPPLWVRSRRAAASVPVTFEGNAHRFAGEHRDFLDRFVFPSIQRAGGLEAARSAPSDSASFRIDPRQRH